MHLQKVQFHCYVSLPECTVTAWGGHPYASPGLLHQLAHPLCLVKNLGFPAQACKNSCDLWCITTPKIPQCNHEKWLLQMWDPLKEQTNPYKSMLFKTSIPNLRWFRAIFNVSIFPPLNHIPYRFGRSRLALQKFLRNLSGRSEYERMIITL